MVPKPRVNLTRFHGVFSPRSRLRAHVVPGKPDDGSEQILQSGKNKAYSRPGRVRMGAEIEAGLRGAASRH
ncbi:MAG: hypothetical protein KC587_15995 [Nitrospira sp.]|nr:hypothetical protein [Nitrospira sp.]